MTPKEKDYNGRKIEDSLNRQSHCTAHLRTLLHGKDIGRKGACTPSVVNYVLYPRSYLAVNRKPACVDSASKVPTHTYIKLDGPISCSQVHLAGLQTCLLSSTSSVLPTVILSLLDFEPLVFELSSSKLDQQAPKRAHKLGFEEEQVGYEEHEEKERNCTSRATAGNRVAYRNHDDNISQSTKCDTNGDGQGNSQSPASFDFNKGKSCIFTADPASLSQALRLPGALTLMVASKLSERQVRATGKHNLRNMASVL